MIQSGEYEVDVTETDEGFLITAESGADGMALELTEAAARALHSLLGHRLYG